jgi:hypothetical protein
MKQSIVLLKAFLVLVACVVGVGVAMAQEFGTNTYGLDPKIMARIAEIRAKVIPPPLPVIDPYLQQVKKEELKRLKKESLGGRGTTSSLLMLQEDSGSEFDDPVSDLSGGESSLSFGTCGTNQYLFYNVPSFNYWMTLGPSSTYYPWGLSINTLSGASGYEAYSRTVNNPFYMQSVIYVNVWNNRDAYGDPLNHRLSFYYYWNSNPSPSDNVLRLSIGSIQGFGGTTLADLDTTPSGWTRVTFNIPPMKNYTGNVELAWMVYKSNTQSLGPEAKLQSVQWCPEVRPSNDDLKIRVLANPPRVRVTWNNLAKPTNYWKLISVLKVPTSWNTNGLNVTVANDVASYTTPITNGVSRFFELMHR